MFSTERFVHILRHHFKEVGLRIKKNVTTNQCKKGVTWEGEGLKYHGKLMTSYMEGPPRLSSISIRYKSHMLFDHNYASIWWEPKKCILQKPQRGEIISERAFLFAIVCGFATDYN